MDFLSDDTKPGRKSHIPEYRGDRGGTDPTKQLLKSQGVQRPLIRKRMGSAMISPNSQENTQACCALHSKILIAAVSELLKKPSVKSHFHIVSAKINKWLAEQAV